MMINMRIDENTGEILSRENHFCPYCDGELMDEYDYCEKCGEYVGIIADNYSISADKLEYTNVNYDQNNRNENAGHEKVCCGICILLFIIFLIVSLM